MAMVEPRTAVSWRSLKARMSWSATRMLPPSTARRLGSRRISARMVTDLPEPDSPMMHSTSPGAISNDTPLTACTVASRLTNLTVRSFTSTSGRVRTATGAFGSAPEVVSCKAIARLLTSNIDHGRDEPTG